MDARGVRPGNVVDSFVELCRRRFEFLTQEHECRLRQIKKYNYDATVTYLNRTTGVQIGFEPRMGGVFVTLARLTEGEFPLYPQGHIEGTNDPSAFDLEDLVKLRGGETVNQTSINVTNPSLDALDRVLVQYAHKLRDYGGPILSGDFSVFPDLAKIVRKRAAYFKAEGW